MCFSFLSFFLLLVGLEYDLKPSCLQSRSSRFFRRTSNPFCSGILEMGVSRTICPCWPGWNLVFQVARMTGVSHQCRPRYDAGRDGFIDLMELKLMMEKLGAPQTHLGLKSMIKEVDEDFDGKLSFREFLLIFHKAAAGELQEDSGLMALAKLSEIDVALEGVKGAKDFFEAKVGACSFSAEPLALPSLCACDRHSVPSDCPICTRWYIMYNSRKMVWGSVHVLAEN
ncbi:EF-hand domain-containing protein D1 isoform X3 [Castor canadensis]|uniref:EF-hand domain-containing protein D1 isoform X3 n=1 Tax=Castor canadensis TaxID=51338 RepID=A0AC58MFC7_CASCN